MKPVTLDARGWTLAVALMFGWPAMAEERVVRPGDVVRRTLAHSYALQSAEQDVVAARARHGQAVAAGLPAFDAKLQAAHYEGLEESQLGPAITIPEISDRYSASVGATLPLFTGGRLAARRRSTGLQRDASRYAMRAAEADVRVQALTTYWNWSKAYYALSSLTSAVARMEAHAADTRSLHEAGLATDNDVLATELLLERTRLRLEESRRGVEIARAAIAFLTGEEWGAGSAPARAEPAHVTAPLPESGLIAAAQGGRAELEARRLEERAARELVGASRSEYWPQAVLMARYEQANPNSMFFPPEEEWREDYFVGGAVTWNFFEWGLTRSKVTEARARAKQAGLRRRQAEEQVTLEIRQARVDLQNALARLQVALRAGDSARRNLEVAENLWKNGLARHSDVLDAHAQLTDAEQEAVVAGADIEIGAAALERAVGQSGESSR